MDRTCGYDGKDKKYKQNFVWDKRLKKSTLKTETTR
jgi:hypothetical protein